MNTAHRLYPNNTILQRVNDYSGPRYPYKYRAYVSTNKDPEERGRLKLIIPSVLGQSESDWAEPDTSPFLGENTGFLWIPEQNDFVWVCFEEGIPDFPIWSGGWSTPFHTPNESGVYSSKQHIIRTPSGLRIILDDGSNGTEYIEMKDSNGDFLQIDATHKKVTMQSGSASIVVDGNAGTVTIRGNSTQTF